MISKVIVRSISRHIILGGFAIAIAAGLASAQEIEPSAVPQKESASEPAAVQKESAERTAVGVQVHPISPVELIAANGAERSPGPNKFSSGFKTTELRKDAFSPDVLKRNAGPAQATGSDWQFSFAPYLYMTGMTGTIGARGRVADIDLDFADVFEHLNLGLMGAFEARKGRFVLTSDLIWIKLGEERETPGELFSSAKLGVNMFVFDPEVGYRL